MKKVFMIMLTVLLALTALTGCSGTMNEENDPTANYKKVYSELGKCEVDLSGADGKLKEILDKGKLVIGTSPDYPAAEFVYEKTGEVMGSEILLAKYIANSLGVELVIESMEFNGVLTGLDTNKIDLGVSGFGYKPDRAEKYELSHGYQATSEVSHHTLLVLAENADKYNSLADFNGKQIDAQANSLQQMYVEDQIADADLQLVATLDQAILDVLTGKVDAAAFDGTSAKNYAAESDGKLVSLYVEKEIEFDLSMYEDFAGNVFACKKNETSFINVINQIIDEVMEKNLYYDWYLVACEAAEIEPDINE